MMKFEFGMPYADHIAMFRLHITDLVNVTGWHFHRPVVNVKYVFEARRHGSSATWMPDVFVRLNSLTHQSVSVVVVFFVVVSFSTFMWYHTMSGCGHAREQLYFHSTLYNQKKKQKKKCARVVISCTLWPKAKARWTGWRICDASGQFYYYYCSV